MTYAIKIDGAAVEVYPGVAFTDAAGIQRPANWIERSSAAERTAAGVLDIVEPPTPAAGKVNRITGLALVQGKPTRTFVVDDAPAPYVPPEPEPIVYKADIARRATDTEAEQLRGLLDQVSAQFWLLYMGVQYISLTAPEFALMRQSFIDLFGEARADQLLAPSEVTP